MLAIETATMDAGVALHDGSTVIAELHLSMGSRHAEALLPAIEHLLFQSGRALSDLTHVVVDRGPGLFTGLRVGVTTARSLAFACDVPVVAVSSLEAVAHQAGRIGETVVSVLDARRREVYIGAYGIEAPGVLREYFAPVVGPPAAALARLPLFDDAPIVAGDGVSTYLDECRSIGVIGSAKRPTAGSVAALGVSAVLRGTAVLEPFELLYLRAPDAEITWDNRHGKASEQPGSEVPR
jgi:tRNA threonylcarbamoyladenosine biosynthesis protein TsaB